MNDSMIWQMSKFTAIRTKKSLNFLTIAFQSLDARCACAALRGNPLAIHLLRTQCPFTHRDVVDTRREVVTQKG